MARFAATAPARAGTTEGIAQPLVRPHYRELVHLEPWLRKLVPVLLLVFLGAIWAGTMGQLLASREDAETSARLELEMTAAMAAATLAARRPHDEPGPALAQSLGPDWFDGGRRLLVANGQGAITLAVPGPTPRQSLTELLADAPPLLILAERAGVMTVRDPFGVVHLAAVRERPDGQGHVAAIQPVGEALQAWRRRALSIVLLLGSTSLVVLTLGLAFNQQHHRAREADTICDQVRDRVDLALHHGRAGLWSWDIARGRVHWSDSMYDLLGLERRADFLSIGEIRSLIHPSDSDLFAAAETLLDGRAVSLEDEFRMRNDREGRWLWFSARGEIVPGRNPGDSPQLVGICIDITEQREWADRTATADLRLRDAVETLDEAFVLWDADRRLVLANRHYRGIEALAPGLKAPCSRLSQGEETVQYELALSDGRWLQISERRTRDGGFVAVGADITAHKLFEERLIQKQVQLERTVSDLKASRSALERQSERLAAMAERYLERVAEAETANCAKAAFLANMSHELRTPLNHILGFSAMIESEIYGPLGDARYRDYIENIGASGRHLRDVIDDVLEMARLEAGGTELRRERVDVAELLASVVEQTRPAAEAKSLALTLETAPDLSLHADRRALHVALLHVVRNAVKFTGHAGRATVRARLSGSTIHIVVADNGVGMTREVQARATRPFEQEGALLENGYRGSGLGLAIAQSYARLHGGSLRMRSQPQRGTVVLFRFPLDPPVVETAERLARGA